MDIFSLINNMQIGSTSNQEMILSNNSMNADDSSQADFKAVLDKAGHDLDTKEPQEVTDDDTDQVQEVDSADSQSDVSEEDPTEETDTSVEDTQAKTDTAENTENDNEIAEECCEMIVDIPEMNTTPVDQTPETTELSDVQTEEVKAVDVITDTDVQTQTDTGTADTDMLQTEIAPVEEVDADADQQSFADVEQAVQVDTESIEPTDEQVEMFDDQLQLTPEDKELVDKQVVTTETQPTPESKVQTEDITDTQKTTAQDVAKQAVESMQQVAESAETTQTDITGQQGSKSNTSAFVIDETLDVDNFQATDNTSDIKDVANIDTAAVSKTAQTSETAGRVVSQVNESIQAASFDDTKQIVINLNPAELGRVTIKLQQEGDQVVGTLEVDKAQTKDDLERALPEVARTLSEAGVNVRRLEVTQTQQTDQQGYKDESSSELQWQMYSDQNSSDQQGTSSENSPYQTAQSEAQSDYYSDDQMSITDDSINILL